MHRCNTEKEGITLTENQIRKIVRITLEEMEGRAEEPYIKIRQEVEKKLVLYFSGKGGADTAKCLAQLADDPYIGIISALYRDHLTMEKTAEILGKDVSTIKRNKKRLILEIYERMI